MHKPQSGLFLCHIATLEHLESKYKSSISIINFPIGKFMLLLDKLSTNRTLLEIGMRLNEFGREVRILRIKYSVPLKSQAESMGISSAHLSALEYGDKKLSQQHIKSTINYFRSLGADDAAISKIKDAGDRSIHSVSLESMDGDARSLVIAFARSLQNGGQPSKEIIDYLKNK